MTKKPPHLPLHSIPYLLPTSCEPDDEGKDISQPHALAFQLSLVSSQATYLPIQLPNHQLPPNPNLPNASHEAPPP
ncbi:hypothetical protein L249_3201 [Ophiocordyceps polyrhachis-furcata BCC 54312]|uniref:Uncharacterized protein n=1 Tax=Ophiocordyceps polyrhachis-furcata BCC 54312 TaxID=1330021 RepID=A0A367LPK1_9HYPO|nr:hypothetical protein L249_3201 [Ophiocordyceps polyrhachis-furcata BCC 54312]